MKTLTASLGAVLLTLITGVSAVSAQATTLMSACYEPATGLVYVIAQAGAPPTCLSTRHVRFTWNEPGDAGPAGPQGAAGTPGAVGEKGEVGLPGVAGAAGPRGTDGVAGPQGPGGPQGVAGPSGPPGPVGSQGLAGAKGPIGAKGVAGPQGDQGPQGESGASGGIGATGPTGPTGAAGAAGPRGDAVGYSLRKISAKFTIPDSPYDVKGDPIGIYAIGRAACGEGEIALSGGWREGDSRGVQIVRESYRDGEGWAVRVQNFSFDPVVYEVSVICARTSVTFP